MFLTSMAYAMGQPPAGAEGGNQLMSFLPLVLMFVVFYFLLIRPQQKKQKEMREMLKNLKRGDKVITGGGIEGRIDAVTDDKVKVEIAPGVVITVLRAYVAGMADAAQPAKKAEKTDEKKADKPEEKK